MAESTQQADSPSSVRVPLVLATSTTMDERGVLCTSSEQVDNLPGVRVAIQYRVKWFELRMNNCKPGEHRWSEGASSPAAPRAIWKLCVYPNGWRDEYESNTSIFFHLTGPMADNKESLIATSHLYLLDEETTGEGDTIRRGAYKFNAQSYSWGDPKISHERVGRMLQPDGSLLVVAEVEFLPPAADVAALAPPSSPSVNGANETEVKPSIGKKRVLRKR